MVFINDCVVVTVYISTQHFRYNHCPTVIVYHGNENEVINFNFNIDDLDGNYTAWSRDSTIRETIVNRGAREVALVKKEFVPGRNSTSGSKRDTSESRSQGGSISDKRSADSSRHEKNGINTETMFGTSSSRYQFRKERDFNARGKFRSRGIGRYGAMSSESTNYLIEGNIDRYGRRRPTNSKFKTLGKEKKYSRRINDNRFDIKGGLYERRQHVGIGDYQANGTQISLIFKTNERSGSSNGTRSGTDSSTHSNNTQLSQQQMWIAP
ncbi:hypothetical protein KSF78_0005020 [Schistosoma japonicum]|nr:hypothetical protein KSF78_0005020 [Schistosoma japonicum]